ncbi:MAG: cation:proton antiporter [Sulfuritalea sp.]|nr:cation:proton antiporter [Sulfuritalea sp.]
MTNAQWFLLIGGLLLARGATASLLARLPVTPAIIYLAVGMLAGPTVLDAFHFNPLKQSALLEVLTEVAVLISLFAAGVKMPVPVSLARWRTPILLATVSMTVTVGLVAAFAWYLLDLPLGAAILLGAILAPTDPVLATDVQIRHPGDRDQLRYTLTCEAGMNDGSAFPFVMLGLGLLGLHDLGEFGLRWALYDVLWATAAGVAIGLLCGAALAHLAWKLRGKEQEHKLMDDFLGLGLIGVVYGLSVMVDAWGFLAVFFAAVALRQTELKLAGSASQAAGADADSELPPTVSEGSLVFKEHLERLSEITLILLIGGTMFLDSWSWRAVALALFLFVVARPLSVLVGLLGTRSSWPIRGMVGWFGVRGIGSLYYLMYAIQHGLPETLALELIQFTLIAVSLSILAHGTSVKPLMGLFVRHRRSLPPP